MRDILLNSHYLFFALNFAHLARCAAAILSRAAADSLRLRPPALDFPVRPLNASIALSNFARSAFNCTITIFRSGIDFNFLTRARFNCLGLHHTSGAIGAEPL